MSTHWLDRLFWGLARVFPVAERGPWLDVPTEAVGPVGPDWPARYAARRGGEAVRQPDGGLLADLDRLEVGALDPMVRDFYAHTARFPLDVGVRWSPGFGLGARIGGWLWFDRWQQLSLPWRTAPMTNQVWRLTGEDPCTMWVRTDRASGRTLYVLRYDVVEAPGLSGPGIRVSFPVPGGAWVVLLDVEALDGGGLALHERGGVAGGAGLYLVEHQGRARYVRWMREDIAVRPTADGLAAVHRLMLFGWTFLTMTYGVARTAR